MASLSWQSVIVLLALIGATTALVWHGSIPSHVFTMLLGGLLTALAPAVATSISSMMQARRASHLPNDFTRDEIPTDKGGRKALPNDKKQ